MDYSSLLINLIIAIIVAVIASNLSLKGFYKQEIWLRKEVKYSQVIDSLSKMQRYYGHIIDDYSDASESNRIKEDVDIREKEFEIGNKCQRKYCYSTPRGDQKRPTYHKACKISECFFSICVWSSYLGN